MLLKLKDFNLGLLKPILKSMKVRILYHPVSEHGTEVEDYARDLMRTESVEAELISLDTREGSEIAKLYDIVRYPAIIVTRDDGQVLQVWADAKLPLMREIAYYAHQ